MFDTTDTIVAIATPAGRSGLGVVRISGPEATTVASRILTTRRSLRPRHATLTHVGTRPDAPGHPPGDGRARAIDQVIATWFCGPHSYTGEDCVEIAAHGSPLLLQQIVDLARGAGARIAAPGEFTLRAFLNGRMDLIQAEAVGDLIEAVTPAQARAAFDQLEGTLTARIEDLGHALFELMAKLEASLDFPDEGYHFVGRDEVTRSLEVVSAQVRELLRDARRGRIIREGCQIVIVGRPNVGKSSLFNALVGTERAIVTATPGTTRDLVTERVDVGGVPVTLVDSAGVRAPDGDIEREGVRRSRAAIDVADVVVVVLDGSEPLTVEDEEVLAHTDRARRVIVANKGDLPPAAWRRETVVVPRVTTSAATGSGLDALKGSIVEALGIERHPRDAPGITNIRHVGLLREVESAVRRAQEAARNDASEELILVDLQQARSRLDEVVGRGVTDDLLRHIFSTYCIGK